MFNAICFKCGHKYDSTSIETTLCQSCRPQITVTISNSTKMNDRNQQKFFKGYRPNFYIKNMKGGERDDRKTTDPHDGQPGADDRSSFIRQMPGNLPGAVLEHAGKKKAATARNGIRFIGKQSGSIVTRIY